MIGEQAEARLVALHLAMEPRATLQVGDHRQRGQHRRGEIELEELQLRRERRVVQARGAHPEHRRRATDQRQQDHGDDGRRRPDAKGDDDDRQDRQEQQGQRLLGEDIGRNPDHEQQQRHRFGDLARRGGGELAPDAGVRDHQRQRGEGDVAERMPGRDIDHSVDHGTAHPPQDHARHRRGDQWRDDPRGKHELPQRGERSEHAVAPAAAADQPRRQHRFGPVEQA